MFQEKRKKKIGGVRGSFSCFLFFSEKVREKKEENKERQSKKTNRRQGVE